MVDVGRALLQFIGSADETDDLIIAYGDLAKKLPYEFNPRNLDTPLGMLSDLCKELDLPLISTIVVNLDSYMPGAGYFKYFFPGSKELDWINILLSNIILLNNAATGHLWLKHSDYKNYTKRLMMEYKKKLIEVALPLEAINAASAREKSIRHGHPSTLHLWWARRPLAAARAVIWSSLVDDPSAHPEQFPDETSQNAERQRLFKILEDLVVWENSNNETVLNAAKAEIMKSTDNNPPALLDPFAGGGAIPLEAQRLGLEAHASDLNPVAVMINKAMIEIPPKFANMPPVNPEARAKFGNDKSWPGASGLAEDVRYYGEWMKKEAFKRIGHLYPKVKVPKEQGGGEATVIAWIWARTVKCPNPACGCEMPLASSFILSKKKGKEAWIEPLFDYKAKKIEFIVKTGKGKSQEPAKIARGAKFKCIMCNQAVASEYIKKEALNYRMSAQLMGIVAEGKNGRAFYSPDKEQIQVADIPKPAKYPTGELSADRRALWTPLYGLDTFDKLFTNRQLTALTTFSNLVAEVQKKVETDATAEWKTEDNIEISEGGYGITAYAQAVCVYLGFAVDREANYCSAQNAWSGDFIIQVFGRQGIPMVWDYAETNPFSNSTGNWSGAIQWIILVLERLPAKGMGYAKQFDAQSDNGMRNLLISTDPPYYDNIGYADLSDYFYIWLRNSIRYTYPKLFKTLLVPKIEELVAIPYRFGGNSEKAKEFFEEGMYHACQRLCKYTNSNYPVTIYYAFKQSDTTTTENEQHTYSTGWETMLSAIIKAELAITGTWPMHTERETGLKASVNALASSIVLVCRKRVSNAPTSTRREFINTLKRELKPALIKLQQSNIAPVDMAQAAIGPGMGVYSRFSQVLEADGTTMSVRSALQIINQELDLFFTDQDGALDRNSRFCVELYSQYAFNEMKFGEADVLARAKGTSVQRLADEGAVYAQKGIVRLLTRDEIKESVNEQEEFIWLLTQQLTRAMEAGGIKACAQIAAPMFGSNVENAKALAYRLFTIADRRGWASEAFAYNALVTAWPDIQSQAAQIRGRTTKQTTLFDSI